MGYVYVFNLAFPSVNENSYFEYRILFKSSISPQSVGFNPPCDH